jgi:hypothetical protein
MNKALIGHTGFVGSTLIKQTYFTHLYNSKNISEIKGKAFDLVVCAGAPAQKWLANKDPEGDLKNINSLIDILKTVKAKNFILISTVDVFKSPVKVNEDTKIETDGLHAYGLHRYYLEEAVKEHFSSSLIVRLPGLIGPGLKKNIIFDFLNNNNIESIESRNVFQFYPMVNLWNDLKKCTELKLSLVHLTAEPISVHEVANDGFGMEFNNHKDAPLLSYDFQTKLSSNFSGSGNYTYSKKETLLAIRSYAQSEGKSL